ncbi:MAG TPA: cbb3-type cytochrome c oxidase N-terminal domain-containing protein [Chitinophagaceae bacterium]
MLTFIQNRSKKICLLLSAFVLLGVSQPVWAAGPPEPSIFSNPLAVTFIVLMILLLIIIGILAHLLIGAADLNLKKRKKITGPPSVMSLLVFLLLSSTSLFAQGNGTTEQKVTAAPAGIGGMDATTFYIMTTVIFLELLIIIVLLVNIRFLLRTEKEKLAEPEAVIEPAAVIEAKRNRLSWWDRFNKLRPVAQEAELDLGHEYDGIRELNNRLPPWWLYGFYLTIIISVIYLWRFHISHTGPSSIEEYETAVAKADLEVKEYLEMKGENVDENTVTLLTASADIDAGKAIFVNPMNCGPCHGEDASGIVAGNPGVGPNLVDDYWLYGGSVKDIFKTIKYGTNKGMRSWKEDLSAKQIAQLTSYIRSLQGTKPVKVKEPQGELYKEAAAPDSLKTMNDTIKAKENKVAMN